MQETVATARQDAMFSMFEQMDAYHPGEPHWHLPLIGVDPARPAYQVCPEDLEGLRRHGFSDEEFLDIVLTAVARSFYVHDGDFFAASQSEWDPETLEERPYDVEKTKRVFLEANEPWRAWSAEH